MRRLIRICVAVAVLTATAGVVTSAVDAQTVPAEPSAEQRFQERANAVIRRYACEPLVVPGADGEELFANILTLFANILTAKLAAADLLGAAGPGPARVPAAQGADQPGAGDPRRPARRRQRQAAHHAGDQPAGHQ
jgi:hypothetical protein